MIGVLPPVDSVTGFQVTPVVGIIPPDLHYHASRDEVSAVFEMPLAEALRLGRYHPLDIHRRGNDHRVWLSPVPALFCLGNDRRDHSRAGAANWRTSLAILIMRGRSHY